jgi:hypothetical protein
MLRPVSEVRAYLLPLRNVPKEYPVAGLKRSFSESAVDALGEITPLRQRTSSDPIESTTPQPLSCEPFPSHQHLTHELLREREENKQTQEENKILREELLAYKTSGLSVALSISEKSTGLSEKEIEDDAHSFVSSANSSLEGLFQNTILLESSKFFGASRSDEVGTSSDIEEVKEIEKAISDFTSGESIELFHASQNITWFEKPVDYNSKTIEIKTGFLLGNGSRVAVRIESAFKLQENPHVEKFIENIYQKGITAGTFLGKLEKKKETLKGIRDSYFVQLALNTIPDSKSESHMDVMVTWIFTLFSFDNVIDNPNSNMYLDLVTLKEYVQILSSVLRKEKGIKDVELFLKNKVNEDKIKKEEVKGMMTPVYFAIEMHNFKFHKKFLDEAQKYFLSSITEMKVGNKTSTVTYINERRIRLSPLIRPRSGYLEIENLLISSSS